MSYSQLRPLAVRLRCERSSIDDHSLAIRLKRELPPTASIPSAMQTVACRLIPLAYFEWCQARYGDAFTMYPVDMAPVVFLSNPDDIHAVLTAPATVLRPGAGGIALAPIVGEDRSCCKTETSISPGVGRHRPLFHSKAVEAHMDMVAEVVMREVESWPLDVVFPIHPRLRSLALRVIMRTVFGDGDFGAGDPAQKDPRHARGDGQLRIGRAATAPSAEMAGTWR